MANVASNLFKPGPFMVVMCVIFLGCAAGSCWLAYQCLSIEAWFEMALFILAAVVLAGSSLSIALSGRNKGSDVERVQLGNVIVSLPGRVKVDGCKGGDGVIDVCQMGVRVRGPETDEYAVWQDVQMERRGDYKLQVASKTFGRATVMVNDPALVDRADTAAQSCQSMVTLNDPV